MSDLSRRPDDQSSRDARRLRRDARRVVEETQLQALQTDGVMALAEHIMTGIVKLDTTRRVLARGDVGVNSILADIEARALLQVRKIQSETFNPWVF